MLSPAQVPRRIAGVVLSLAALVAAMPCAAIEYDKFVIFDGVKAGASVDGGALVETWAGAGHSDSHATIGTLTRQFTHASKETAKKDIHGATLKQIIQPGAAVVFFTRQTETVWDPARITAVDPPPHAASSSATSKVSVHSEPSLTRKVREDKTTVKEREFKNAVTVTLSGSAVAGVPSDGDKYHSADSWAGVSIAGAETFTNHLGDVPRPFTIAGKTGVAHAGAADEKPGKPQGHHDPYFITVNDLTTGDSTSMEIMRESVYVEGADVFMDDTGIRLSVNRHNPLSSVRFDFSSETPWVLNPYAYGASLDNSGFTLYGDALPLAGWVITMTADRISASFDYGADGIPLDSALVAPPASLFTAGHDYSYDLGGGGGAFAIATAEVPEPQSWALLLGGLAGLVALRRRQRSLMR